MMRRNDLLLLFEVKTMFLRMLQPLQAPRAHPVDQAQSGVTPSPSPTTTTFSSSPL